MLSKQSMLKMQSNKSNNTGFIHKKNIKSQIKALQSVILGSKSVVSAQCKMKNSKIVNKKEQIRKLQGFFDKKCKISDFKLLYRASENKFSCDKFYQKCSKVPNTLVLIRTQSNRILGGYNPLFWDNSSDLLIMPQGSFIFFLEDNEKITNQIKRKKQKKKDIQQQNRKYYQQPSYYDDKDYGFYQQRLNSNSNTSLKKVKYSPMFIINSPDQSYQLAICDAADKVKESFIRRNTTDKNTQKRHINIEDSVCFKQDVFNSWNQEQDNQVMPSRQSLRQSSRHLIPNQQDQVIRPGLHPYQHQAKLLEQKQKHLSMKKQKNKQKVSYRDEIFKIKEWEVYQVIFS